MRQYGDSAPVLFDKLPAYIFHTRAKSIECAAKSIKPVELADEGRVQYGARDVAVRMRIVSNMKRENTSLIKYRNIKSSRTSSDSKATELYDFAGFRRQATHE